MRIHNYSLTNRKPTLVNDLIRVGNKKKDGGYVISERQIGLTKILIGLGIHYDWSFEEEYKKKNRGAILNCYDFSVGRWDFIKGFILSLLSIISPNKYANAILNKRIPDFFLQPFIEISTLFRFLSFFKPSKQNYFFRKGISDFRSKRFITTHDMFNNIKNFNDLPEDSVFLKMDIEGSEYDVLEDILPYSSKINGMVIEFHNLKQLWNEFNLLLDKLIEDYEIVHMHGNNCCGYINDTRVPNLLEFSFIKRKLLKTDEINLVNNKSYPIAGLDIPNFSKPDLIITF